jgi:hypothetical protein
MVSILILKPRLFFYIGNTEKIISFVRFVDNKNCFRFIQNYSQWIFNKQACHTRGLNLNLFYIFSYQNVVSRIHQIYCWRLFARNFTITIHGVWFKKVGLRDKLKVELRCSASYSQLVWDELIKLEIKIFIFQILLSDKNLFSQFY